MDAGRATAAFAVIGFGEVGELEIDREGFGNAVGIFDAELLDDLASLLHPPGLGCTARSGFGFDGRGRFGSGHLFAMLDEQAAQSLDDIEERLTGLLHEHRSEQGAQGADVSPQWRLLRWIGGAGRKLGKAGLLVV
jgi:hypothetical protein